MGLDRHKLIGFIVENSDVEEAELNEDTVLFSSGILDSFMMVELIAFLEDELTTKIRVTEINLDNFDTIGRILAFADSKARA